MTNSFQPRRRLFRYSLRTLLILMTVAACGFGWLGYEVKQAKAQKEAVQAILGLRGEVWYEGGGRADLAHPPTAPDVPNWLRQLLGDNFFAKVTGASFFGTHLVDDDLAILDKLPRLELLEISTNEISDSGLKHIARLSDLRTLALSETKVGDEGLSHLRELTQLESLYLHRTQITDAGLPRLSGLTRLKKLWLSDTQVSDAGLKHLQGLTVLEQLWLGGTNVTDDGVTRLQQALPNLTIHRDTESDL